LLIVPPLYVLANYVGPELNRVQHAKR